MVDEAAFGALSDDFGPTAHELAGPAVAGPAAAAAAADPHAAYVPYTATPLTGPRDGSIVPPSPTGAHAGFAMDPYGDDDFGEVTRQREAAYHIVILSPEFQRFRDMLAAWMLPIMTLTHGVSPHTAGSALRFLDLVLENSRLLKGQLQCVVCVCFWVAAKAHEPIENVPTLDELVAHCGSAHDRLDFINMEAHVLRRLDWNLNPITVPTFLNHWAPSVILDSDTVNWGGVTAKTLNLLHVRVYAIASIVYQRILHNSKFATVPPSELTACMLRAARRACGLTPEWPEELCQMTQYLAADLDASLMGDVWAVVQATIAMGIDTQGSPPDVTVQQ